MRQIKICLIFVGLLLSAEAGNTNGKHNVRCNMQHNFYELPEEVTNIEDMFSQGVYYGRVRFNSFGYKWGEELNLPDGRALRKDHAIAAVGGSLLYKTGSLHGFSLFAGVYGSQAAGTLKDNSGYLYKAGKGALNREDLLDGKSSILSFAEGYIEYKYKDTFLKAGRQIFESYLTRSNDTKMIPNTFEGFTLHSNAVKNTTLSLAYFGKQKLRDHSDFHHVLAFGYDGDDISSAFSQNDDSAMHIGLLLSKLEAKGIEDRLLVAEVKHTDIANLILTANHGAGAIGGANLKTLTTGYNNPESLDTEMYAARIDVVQDAFKLRFGMTHIADKGDILAPWRGFPTSGFTRAMAQYNWYANTKSYMVQLDYETEFYFVEDVKIISRFVVQDFDDSKEGVQADSNVFTFDIAKRFDELHMIFKTRYAHVIGESGDVVFEDGFSKLNPSYDEIRFEINYLF